jgi:DnaK suppressor protein
MNEEEKAALKIEISKRLRRLEEQIEDLKELSKPIEPDCAIGRVSRMDAINNKTINESALRKKRLQKAGMEAALDNIDQKDFGKCLNCGKNIQMGRILIMPESRKCMQCSNQ